ncbi:hypothetical protein [Streptomyces sp. NPDC046909]|uniref:hypothetical protein n=1 Tax=Streptomyces sp. NPDC046909 TaxID=3155617 RepID=UPI0033CC48B6
MTPHRRYQHGATVGAVLLAATATGAGLYGMYVPAVVFGFGVLVLTEAAFREHRRHQRLVLEHDWARRRSQGETPPPLTPCCLLARASKGEAHDHKCTDVSQWAHHAEPHTSAPAAQDCAS